MDLAKLLSLLERRQLFFPRSDQLEDPYEGLLSRAAVNLLRREAERSGYADAAERMIENLPRFRESVFINCWTAADHESAAMWRLYLKSPEGVAIRTDHARLCAALDRSPLTVRTTTVQYIDYDTDPIPAHNVLFPFVHKRHSFSHETELRAIIWAGEDKNIPLIPADAKSVAVDVGPEELIQAIHVAPQAEQWFGELVEQLVRRYGLSIPVVRSGLYDRPVY